MSGEAEEFVEKIVKQYGGALDKLGQPDPYERAEAVEAENKLLVEQNVAMSEVSYERAKKLEAIRELMDSPNPKQPDADDYETLIMAVNTIIDGENDD